MYRRSPGRAGGEGEGAVTKQELKDKADADRARADAARRIAIAAWNKADAMPDDIAPSP